MRSRRRARGATRSTPSLRRHLARETLDTSPRLHARPDRPPPSAHPGRLARPARRSLMCTVTSAPAAFRVRVWQITFNGEGTRGWGAHRSRSVLMLATFPDGARRPRPGRRSRRLRRGRLLPLASKSVEIPWRKYADAARSGRLDAQLIAWFQPGSLQGIQWNVGLILLADPSVPPPPRVLYRFHGE
jgi:hypothetical protein